MTGPDPTGGEGISYAGSQVAEGLYKTLMAGLTFVIIPVIIVADLFLGPMFLWAQAVSENVELDALSVFTPILFSFATTGLQYGLWQTIGDNYGNKWIKVIAWSLAVADTLTDIGGLNWALNGNAEAGRHFVPLAGTESINIFLMYFGGVLLLVHEIALRWILGRKQAKVNVKGTPVGLGNQIEAGVIFFSGVILNCTDFLAKVGAVVAIVFLDVILTPQLADGDLSFNTVQAWALWLLSLMLTVLTAQTWRRCQELGGVKKALEITRADPAQKRFTYVIYGLFVMIIVDTCFDVAGYNNAMYGEASVLIDNPSPAWVLTVAMLVVLCGMGELLNRTMFTILGDKSRRRSQQRRAASGKGGKPGGPGGWLKRKKKPSAPAPGMPGMGAGPSGFSPPGAGGFGVPPAGGPGAGGFGVPPSPGGAGGFGAPGGGSPFGAPGSGPRPGGFGAPGGPPKPPGTPGGWGGTLPGFPTEDPDKK